MKLAITAAAIAFVSASAFAAGPKDLSDSGKEFLMACKAYQAENGGSSDCKCLAHKVDKDPSLAGKMSAIKTPADVEAADDTVKAALAACPKKDM